MALTIRDVRESDLDAVLAINNTSGPGILCLNQIQLRYFFERADYFRVAEINSHLTGFLIALQEGHHYASINYRWFCERYRQFVYIDRIVIATAHQGRGLGHIFYCDVSSFAEVRAPLMTCEVFLEPRNDMVLLFHGSHGFQEVGQKRITPERRVSLLLKELPGYAYVRDTWLAHGGLPDQSWLTGRHLTVSPDAQVRNPTSHRTTLEHQG